MNKVDKFIINIDGVHENPIKLEADGAIILVFNEDRLQFTYLHNIDVADISLASVLLNKRCQELLDSLEEEFIITGENIRKGN